jgi:hypothetical protein
MVDQSEAAGIFFCFYHLSAAILTMLSDSKRRIGSNSMKSMAVVLSVLAAVALRSPPSVEAVSERNNNNINHITGKATSSSSTTATVFTRPNHHAVIPPPPTTTKSSIIFNDTAAATVVNNCTGVVRNDNGTEVDYMTAADQEDNKTPFSLLYEIDAYIQEKIIPSLLQQQQQQQQERPDSPALYYLPSMLVGVLTAAVGFGYVQVLSRCRNLLWNTLPQSLSSSNIPAVVFIAGMTTLGGLVLGYFTTYQSTPIYTASDFVEIMSKHEHHGQQEEEEEEEDDTLSSSLLLPLARQHLLPLLGISFLTSSFGIPLGPEAPMVSYCGVTCLERLQEMSSLNNIFLSPLRLVLAR